MGLQSDFNEICHNNLIHAARVLLETGKVDPSDKMALMYGLERTQMMQVLIDYGAKVDTPLGSSDPWTALFFASRAGDRAMIELLLCAGANINLTTKGASALYLAAYNNHVSICELLLSRGAHIDTLVMHLDRFGDLMKHPGVMQLLLHNTSNLSEEYVPIWNRHRLKILTS
jgi:ankyrin repeat protein